MSLRSRAALIRKAFTTSGAPEPMQEAALGPSQMGFENTFAPGVPIGPYDGYQRHPRQQDFVTGYNIATRPRSHERVSFDTLKGLIGSYDVALMSIYHRIDSLRSLDWKLVAKEGYDGDVADAIDVGLAALKKPDRERTFDNWLSAWLFDVLAYDAGALYRLRNRAGNPVGLLSIDGCSVAPLLDYWGMTPQPPAEAYVQYVQGLPWNWLTQDDLIYQPMRPHNDSPYGQAPVEIILLNANTDIRFQLYFLQRFTEGNIPEAFAAAPETWTPAQIEQFQEYWDGFMLGDQSRKHQIRWMPGGSSFAWSNEKDFTDTFSLFLMRKTCAAFHVVPSDLGFTENVNRSSGESQADVQHRVGDLPLINYVEGILDGFLQEDLGLPIAIKFDRGEEQVDQLAQAQADKLYVDMGTIGPSELREIRYGRPEPDGIPVPRYIMTGRGGPVPIASLMAVAGKIDPATGAPLPGAELPHTVFAGAEGVLPNPPLHVMSLAEQAYGPKAMPPAPPPQPQMTAEDVGLPAAPDTAAAPVAKEGDSGGPGITANTGIYGDPLLRDDDDQDDDDTEQVAKSELAAYRRYVRSRRKAGTWRNFRFATGSQVAGHRLNDAGRAEVRKATGDLVAAGLAVLAADTGRVLMIQRALCDDDPAAGKVEFPGGHIEDSESPLTAAWREWAEETGCVPPPGVQTGSWLASNGVYQGVVWTVDREAAVPVRGGPVVPNPDDPDGDLVEAILWMDPADLPGNPAVRDELLDDIDLVLSALGAGTSQPAEGDQDVCPCGAPVVYDETNGWQHADGSISHEDGESVSDKMAQVAKAATPGPKGWPGWSYDEDTRDHWAGKLTAAVLALLTASRARALAAAYLAANPGQDGSATGKNDRNAAAAAWLTGQGFQPDTSDIAEGVVADSQLIGVASAEAVSQGGKPQLGGWQPGKTAAATAALAALGAGEFLGYAPQARDVAGTLTDGVIAGVARVLAGADGDMAAADLADTMRAAVADGSLASTLVMTQITALTGRSALAYYQANTTGMLQWVGVPDASICQDCLNNVNAGPRRAGEPWPSGDTAPPVHPLCRCGLVPTHPAQAGP